MSNTASRSSAQIRQDFLDFFASKGHTIVPSSSLVPGNDPTLLFTNAGMVQFKDVFLGAEKRSYTRAVSSQRCVRAGGKHNDLDQVGYTARHHTFFEMLGNFSFGDYFKKDAIHFAWELLTGVWALPKDKLLVTIYYTDDEAFDIWHKEIGLPVERIIRIGDNKGAPYASDNFWQMADTGPCGPCTEIFYDHGEQHFGGPPGSPDEDGDRFIEIWNNVFMQFDRQADGSLLPLPAPCVDTGMGLERIAAVLQHVHSNYEIDLFEHLIQYAAKLTQTEDLTNKSLRVIADHIRACSFLIVDGVLPSNEGRGYVLRRIVRRATRHLWKLGALHSDGLFWQMLSPLIDMMGSAYPELFVKRNLIEQALKAEEAAFSTTLDSGMMRLETMLQDSNGAMGGEQLFLLHDTYGCPPDLIIDVLRERALEPAQSAMQQYDELMDQQRERARGASKFAGSVGLPAELVASLHSTEFKGYEHLEVEGCKIVAIIKEGLPVQCLPVGEQGAIILDRTPFYAESGGQIGDSGVLCSASGQQFLVSDTQKLSVNLFGHIGEALSGNFSVGDKLSARVDSKRRQATVINHSATHLLHAALRKVLGEHVSQKGSLVSTERTRFDFSHFQAISAEQINEIESLVNSGIRANAEAEVHHMGMQEAIEFGAMALFGEKYGEHVRVLKMGDFSTELCGGTHVHRTGDIGLFKIISEAGIAAGVRRIEAVTGANALASYKHSEDTLSKVAALVNGRSIDVLDKINQLLERQKKLEQELDTFKSKAANNQSHELANTATNVAGIAVVSARLQALDGKALNELLDNLKLQLPNSIVVIASAQDGKVALVVGVQGAAQAKVKAGEVLSHIASQIGGKGGGRADFARGGGDDGPALIQALAQLNNWLETRLN